MNRREFIKRSVTASVIAGTAAAGMPTPALAKESRKVATMIDLTKCDGCPGEKTPKCVLACRTKNQARYPEPVENILPYWPQKKYEDWSEKRELTGRLTPYNWIFVQKAQVAAAGKNTEVYLPRRCMHCDNPPCAKLCPFGVNEKTAEGAVVINPDFCMGGAKCRDVCPWEVPQRQAGVGLYLQLAPKFAGGGVMYKCDLCIDLVREGKAPACVGDCPQKAISFGARDEIIKLAQNRAKEVNGYIYGDKENGGTSTLYVSKISFQQIEEALEKQEKRFLLRPGVPNPLESAENLVKAVLLAPVAGIFAGGIAAYRTMKGEKKNVQ
jgi:Fe-S-cluster-containing dehydrogenase component